MRIKSWLVVAGLLCLGNSGAAAQSRGFGIEQVTGAPFAQALSTGGATIAWVHNTRGVRNVWAATGPEFRGRQLTAYTQDDGQEIEEVTVAPDGKTVFYVRGGAPNRRGETPNPTSDPNGQEEALWRVAVAGGAPVKVANGTGAVVAPKSDWVVFTKAGQVWSAPVTGPGEARQLFKANAERLPPNNKRPPKIILATSGPTSVLTTDFFGFDTSKDTYHLQGKGSVSEMGDAVLGLVESQATSPVQWLAVRNVSDPQIKSEGTLKQQAKVAAQIYKGYGHWSSVCSAIVCWALIAA